MKNLIEKNFKNNFENKEEINYKIIDKISRHVYEGNRQGAIMVLGSQERLDNLEETTQLYHDGVINCYNADYKVYSYTNDHEKRVINANIDLVKDESINHRDVMNRLKTIEDELVKLINKDK